MFLEDLGVKGSGFEVFRELFADSELTWFNVKLGFKGLCKYSGRKPSS